MNFSIHESETLLTSDNRMREKYNNAVFQAKEHIDSGDVFPIDLSQPFLRRKFVDPFEVYI